MASITAHFSDIKKKLLEELRTATKSIQIAVAWFTDEELMAELTDIRFRHPELKIQVIISNSSVNFRNPHNLNRLLKKGIELRVMREDSPFLHHKFCLLDGHTVINGSYNWTYYAAQKNEENITVIKPGETDVVHTQFKARFNRYMQEDHSVAYQTDLIPAAAGLLLNYDAEQIDLRRQFQERVLHSLEEIRLINPTRPAGERIRITLIEDMIVRYGDGVTMVKRLLRDVHNDNGQLQPKSGFVKLVDWGRQHDLSFESMVVDPEFESLFSNEEKHIAAMLLH